VRVVLALEVFRATGRPLSEHHGAGEAGPSGAVCVIGLAPELGELRRRIEARTRGMLEAGLIDEVRGLLQRGYGPELRPLRAIGYRQAVAVALGEMAVADAERDIVTETMRYAKRQMTWFRHQTPGVRWHPSADEALQDLFAWLSSPEAG
jgi:tRNA dimethylallyltransferase